ncbi:MAG: hypothetical protein EHM28_07900, partial [Spirochaetaceae bacterium]
MKRGNFTVLLAYACMLFGCAGKADVNTTQMEQNEGKLLCGATTVDITPGFPVSLAGYPNRPLSGRVLDPLAARIVSMRLGASELMLISLDLCGLYATADVLIDEIARAVSLEKESIFLSATHNHSGPVLAWGDAKDENPNVRYTRELRDRLVAGIANARANLKTVYVAAGMGISPVGINRRIFQSDKTRWSGVNSMVPITRSPGGPTDPEVRVVGFLREEDLSWQSIMFSYSCHNRSFRDSRTAITADIFGQSARMAEARFGVPAAPFAGA